MAEDEGKKKAAARTLAGLSGFLPVTLRKPPAPSPAAFFLPSGNVPLYSVM